jgi:hypothetical protein
MNNKLFAQLSLLVFLLAAGFSSASGQNCLEYGPSVSLTGTISSRVFAGPPNYESIRRGDRKETAIILTLASPVCTTANDTANSFDVAETDVREVQLVITKPELWKALKRSGRKPVVVTGTLFHSHTGHHRTQILIFVAELHQKQ